ncbi:amino acid ABC transporter permease [Allostreptomyces psammosilenae]|uniref:Glutamate transport system permease protein n=1 Tax=Allostreptomyces psammosilenae TaxID=1892865 RepID=A0A852ZYA5_9ACTN|nr:amino acid ABC transporter permease [Allostreptomyces psammosilenae]NYI03078.1 glutamate transport system permease protein [Allostreptomyces psammosilenae]
MSSSVLYDAPGPRARLRNRVISVVTGVALVALVVGVIWRLDSTGQFAARLWEPFQYVEIQERILGGVLATLQAFALAGLFSLVLGAALAIGRLSDHAWVRLPCAAVVEFFRAMPLLVMIFALYLAFFTATPLWALVIGLTLYNGAVQAEVIRAGINAVPRGQREAAYALGLRKSQVMMTVLLPQAVRSMLPTIISQLVVTLKDTSLGFIITYEELLYVGRLIASNSSGYPYIPVVLVIAPIYIGLCMALSALATWLERRGRRNPRLAGRPGPTGAGAENDMAQTPLLVAGAVTSTDVQDAKVDGGSLGGDASASGGGQ